MKIILISILISTGLLAQGGLTIFGGYNMSTIRFNLDKQIIDISPQDGFNFGLEYHFPRFIFGAGFLQRGSKLKSTMFTNIAGIDYEIEIGGHEIYEYAAAHILYPISINNQIKVFGGVQIGSALGGVSFSKFTITEFNSSKVDNIHIKPETFGLDAGLHFGIDYMLNDRLGLRSSYYMGMTDVIDTLNDSLKFKNQTINLSAIIKLKGLRKNPSLIDKDSKINSKSNLLLPSRSLEVQMAGRIESDNNTQSKISLEYGLRDDITIGISNSNYLNTYDIFVRTGYFNRFTNKFGIPIKLIFNSIISNQLDKTIIIDEYDKLSFLNQFIVEYKLRSNLRLKLCPTYLHKNIADTKLEPKGYPWDIWFLETGLNWLIRDNVELYGDMIKQITDLDIAQGSKSSIKIGLQYFMKTIGLDFSITNLYHLHGTAIIDDIGVNDYSENLRIGFQINKMFTQIK